MDFEMSELGVKLTPAYVDAVGLDEKIELAEQVLNELDALEVDAHTEKYAKAKRAEVNKFIKALSAERIAKEKIVLGNWEETKTKIKDLEKRSKATSDGLKDGLNKLEEDRKNNKREMVNAEITKLAEQFNIEPDLIAFDERWLNASYSWVAMQDEIAGQAEKIVSDRERMAMQIELLEGHAEKLDVEPSGYIGMLTNGIEMSVVRAQMKTDARARELRLEAQKEREAQQAKEHAERMEKAQKVGNKMVDVDSGEVIEPMKPTATNYLFKLSMTPTQYEQMKANFKKWGIYVNDKQV